MRHETKAEQNSCGCKLKTGLCLPVSQPLMLICIFRGGPCGDERNAMQRRHSSNTDGMPSERCVEEMSKTAQLLSQDPLTTDIQSGSVFYVLWQGILDPVKANHNSAAYNILYIYGVHLFSFVASMLSCFWSQSAPKTNPRGKSKSYYLSFVTLL